MLKNYFLWLRILLEILLEVLYPKGFHDRCQCSIMPWVKEPERKQRVNYRNESSV